MKRGIRCCAALAVSLSFADVLRGDEAPPGEHPLVEALRERAVPFDGPDTLTPLVDRLRTARVVLLGEASHGTSEFYAIRDRLTRQLIEHHGFRFVAVEGDWNALYRLNRYVKGREGAGESAREVMRTFSRWPAWMWANEETEALIEWLRAHNAGLPPEKRAGFYGIDVYGNADALHDLPLALEGRHPDRAEWLRAQLECLAPYASDFGAYVQAVQWGMPACAEALRELVETLRDDRETLELDPDDYLHLKQMAHVVKNAERHYRAMAQGGPASWNYRAGHFFQTVDRLMRHYGPEARGIVWAHNTHIGDARATPMARGGQHNIGQLAREHWGAEQVAAVGFATHRGSVVAGRAWGGPREIMPVPPAGPGTLEDFLHRTGLGNFWIPLDEPPAALREPVGHRAIGVIYHPEQEFPGNYVPTLLPARYDFLVFSGETRALSPLD